MKKLFKLIVSFFSWVKNLFTSKKDEKLTVDAGIDGGKLPIDDKTKQLMDDIVRKDLDNPSKDLHHTDSIAHLQESARVRNKYNDMYNSIKGFNEPSTELKNKLKTEGERDTRILNEKARELGGTLSKKEGPDNGTKGVTDLTEAAAVSDKETQDKLIALKNAIALSKGNINDN
jgi:hypothetical protein